MALEPLIVEVAINGRVSKKENPHVPVTTAEMVASVEACVEAGATVVHAHASDAFYGNTKRHASAQYRETFTAVLKRHPELVLYPTFPAGGTDLPIGDRYAHIKELVEANLLKMVPVDPGTMNWGIFSADGSENEERIFKNTFGDVRYVFNFCNTRALGCTMGIFEPGFLQLVLAHARAGTLPKGSAVKLEFSGRRYWLFGMPATREGLDAYLSMLREVRIPWFVNYRGGDFMDGFGRLVLERGGHVRVGIEDYGGPRIVRNQDLVAEIVELARSVGRRPATRPEALAMLGLSS